MHITEAKCREVEQFYREAARRLIAETSPLPFSAMRVGPGTDAVVWKVCDTNQTVEL